jgi:ribose transport system permease protein
MTDRSPGTLTAPRPGTEEPPSPRPPLRTRLLNGLAFDKVGAVYVWIAIIIIFSIWVPNTFPTAATAKQILNTNAVTAMAALAITIPLSARVFDLSFAFIMTLTGVLTTKLIVAGVGLVPSLVLGVLVGLGIGLINATIVVIMNIDSFIATLASGSLIQALITMVTNGNSVTSVKLAGSFAKIGQTSIAGVTLPVIYFLVEAFCIWYLLEHTATGRRLYATGFNADAARLAGVRVNRLRFLSLVASGTLAGAAGIVLAAILGSGDPTAGSPYLLPAFAAAFLGATQLKKGRFNAWGTVIAILLLGTGTTGLALAAAPQWSQDMFVGVVLIAALAVTSIQRRTAVSARGSGVHGAGIAGTDQPGVETSTPLITEN